MHTGITINDRYLVKTRIKNHLASLLLHLYDLNEDKKNNPSKKVFSFAINYVRPNE